MPFTEVIRRLPGGQCAIMGSNAGRKEPDRAATTAVICGWIERAKPLPDDGVAIAQAVYDAPLARALA